MLWNSYNADLIKHTSLTKEYIMKNSIDQVSSHTEAQHRCQYLCNTFSYITQEVGKYLYTWHEVKLRVANVDTVQELVPIIFQVIWSHVICSVPLLCLAFGVWAADLCMEYYETAVVVVKYEKCTTKDAKGVIK